MPRSDKNKKGDQAEEKDAAAEATEGGFGTGLRAQLQKRRHAAAYDDPPCVRLDRSGDQLQCGALAGPV